MHNGSQTIQETMTLEKLAAMIAAGFEQTATKEELKALSTKTDGRFDKVEERLTKVEDRLINVEDRLTNVEHKLDKALYAKTVRLENRIKNLETKPSGA